MHRRRVGSPFLGLAVYAILVVAATRLAAEAIQTDGLRLWVTSLAAAAALVPAWLLAAAAWRTLAGWSARGASVARDAAPDRVLRDGASMGSSAGVGLALGLALADGALTAAGGAGARAGLIAAAASSALVVPAGLVAFAVGGVLLARALDPPGLHAHVGVVWSAGPAHVVSRRLVAGVVALVVFLGLHRAALAPLDAVVRSDTLRAVAAAVLGVGAWALGWLAARIAARLWPAPPFRPRTLLAGLALGVVAAAASTWIVARPFAEALGLGFFLAPAAAAVGMVAGVVLAYRGRERALVLLALGSAVIGAVALSSPDTRADVAWSTFTARRVLALVPSAADDHVRAEEAPEWFTSSAPPALVSRRPVVLVSLDAVGADHLDLYGGPRETAPALTAWARRGVIFDAAVPPGPVTRLSVPSFFAGLQPAQVAMTRRTGATSAQREADTTLAERLSAVGYHTVAVPGGRYFVGFRGMMQGFREVDRTAANETSRLETRGAIVTKRAIAALEAARARTAPTFLWFHYDDAHAPHSAIEGAPAFGQRQSDRYDQEIWWIDRQLATLLPAIDRILGDRDPLILVTADHGERFGPDGRALDRAQALVPGTLWVPLIVRVAGLPAHRVGGAVSLLDLTPTVLDLVGVTPRVRFEGRSLVPELRGARDDRERTVFAELDQAGARVLEAVAARQGDHLLLVDRVRGARRSYDLARDPRGVGPGDVPVPPALARHLDAHVARIAADFARWRDGRGR